VKPEISFVSPALILGAVFCFIAARVTAQVMVGGGLWPSRDLTLLDQRTNTLGSRQSVLEVGEATMTFSEAVLATNRPVLKLGGPDLAPVICEILSPCRVVIKSSKPGERMHFSTKSCTFSGGVKVEVLMREHPAFCLTADEVKVEH
jgi:hypothetical protein